MSLSLSLPFFLSTKMSRKLASVGAVGNSLWLRAQACSVLLVFLACPLPLDSLVPGPSSLFCISVSSSQHESHGRTDLIQHTYPLSVSLPQHVLISLPALVISSSLIISLSLLSIVSLSLSLSATSIFVVIISSVIFASLPCARSHLGEIMCPSSFHLQLLCLVVFICLRIL